MLFQVFEQQGSKARTLRDDRGCWLHLRVGFCGCEGGWSIAGRIASAVTLSDALHPLFNASDKNASLVRKYPELPNRSNWRKQP